VMHPKTSCASIIWNWLSCNLGDWMTIIVSAYQRRIIRESIAGENRQNPTRRHFDKEIYQSLAFWNAASAQGGNPSLVTSPE